MRHAASRLNLIGDAHCGIVSAMARPTATQLSLLDQIVEMDAKVVPPLGFPPLATVMCLLPGSKPLIPKPKPGEENPEYKPGAEYRTFNRSNNGWTVAWTAGMDLRTGANIGLPYGPKARLTLAHWCGEAIRNDNPLVSLGPSKSGFIRDLGLARSSGKTGSDKLLGEHVTRLVRARIGIERDFEEASPGDEGDGMRIGKSWRGSWGNSGNPTHPTEDSYIQLSSDFFDEIRKHSFPVNLDALGILQDSALAIDMYMWLTYRLRQLQRPVRLSWEQLCAQFGVKGLPPLGAPGTCQGSEANGS